MELQNHDQDQKYAFNAMGSMQGVLWTSFDITYAGNSPYIKRGLPIGTKTICCIGFRSHTNLGLLGSLLAIGIISGYSSLSDPNEGYAMLAGGIALFLASVYFGCYRGRESDKKWITRAVAAEARREIDTRERTAMRGAQQQDARTPLLMP
jgi:hypothetical protein